MTGQHSDGQRHVAERGDDRRPTSACPESPRDPGGAGKHDQGERYRRVEALLEWPMMVLAVLFVVAMLSEDAAQLPQAARVAAAWACRLIWGAFALEYFVLLVLARRRILYLRTHIIDALIVLVPVLRVLRFGRLLRVLRVLRIGRTSAVVLVAARQWLGLREVVGRRGLGYVAAALLLMLLGGAYIMYRVEVTANTGFTSYGASLWWALVTATTVGYGDAAPVTFWGRIVAAIFMLIGVGVFGAVSAILAAHFVNLDQDKDTAAIVTKLDRIESRLERIEAGLDEHISA